MRHNDAPHRLGATLAQPERAGLVGRRVANRGDPLDLGVVPQHRRDLVDEELRLRPDLRRAADEIDVIDYLDRAVRNDDEASVRTPVLVDDAIVRLGLVGALIALVRDVVLIIVGIGTAVVVLESVAILGGRGASVVDVGDPVAVRVAITRRRRREYRQRHRHPRRRRSHRACGDREREAATDPGEVRWTEKDHRGLCARRALGGSRRARATGMTARSRIRPACAAAPRRPAWLARSPAGGLAGGCSGRRSRCFRRCC